MPNLPDLGRSGIVNSVRKLYGFITNPSRSVDSSAEFIAGMIGALTTDTNGNPVVVVADSDDTNVIGMFYCHKTLSFYRPIMDEPQTFGTDPNTSTIAYLNHANLKSSTGYIKVTNAAGTPYTNGINFTVSATNGYIKRNGNGISSTGTIYVSYLYQDPNQAGIDQTLGSGQAAMLEGVGEIATLVYDPECAYTLMNAVYCNDDGIITSSTGSKVIGYVTKVPSAENPELNLKISL